MSSKNFKKDKTTESPHRQLPKQSIDHYRESLLDKYKTLEVANFFIQKALEDEKTRISNGENPPAEPEFWLGYFKHALEHDTLNSIDFIFQYSESPIETIFLNSLLLSFITIRPLYSVLD